MKKRIMILGAGRGQLGLYNAAKKMGIETVAASIDGDYPGFSLADRKHIVDITDVEQVVASARDLEVDGIVTACLDIGLPAIGAAHDRLGLAGLSEKAAGFSTNKLLMKDALADKGVPTARYLSVSREEELEDVLKFLDMPLITKPVDLWSSTGIHVVETEDQLYDCFRRTMAETKKDFCIVEEYLDGYECSATAFVAGGRVAFILPMGDVRYGEHEEFPVGHYLPLDENDDLLEDISHTISDGIEALELDDCAVNADLMIYNGKPYILEMTGRLGSNTIPELTSLFTGRDIHELILLTALGEGNEIHSFIEKGLPGTPCLGRMIFSEKDGIFSSAEYADDARDLFDGELIMGSDVSQIWFFTSLGEEISSFRSAADCLGQIVVTGSDLKDCRNRMDASLSKLDIRISGSSI